MNEENQKQECPFCLEQVDRLPHLCHAESDARLATLHSLVEDVIAEKRRIDLAVHGISVAPLFDKIESMNIGLGSAMALERVRRNRLEKAVCEAVIEDLLDGHATGLYLQIEPAFLEYAKYVLANDRPAYNKPPEKFIKLAEIVKRYTRNV